jgi:hypothetical protein
VPAQWACGRRGGGGEERIAKVCFIWMRTILAGQYRDDPKSCCARAQTTVPRVRLKPDLSIVSGWPVTRSPSCRVVLFWVVPVSSHQA